MARGRPRKPTHQKILEGTYRPDREPSNPLPLECLESVPNAPSYLTKSGQKVWRIVADRLQKLGVLYDIHQEMLGMYCNEVGLYQEMSLEIKKKLEDGRRLYNSPAGRDPKKIPELRIRDDALKHAMQLGARFGFTLADIKQINLPDDAVATSSGDNYADGRSKMWAVNGE
jgi:P27 family predicted phage terminase small subunit